MAKKLDLCSFELDIFLDFVLKTQEKKFLPNKSVVVIKKQIRRSVHFFSGYFYTSDKLNLINYSIQHIVRTAFPIKVIE